MLIQLEDNQPKEYPVAPENFRMLFPKVSFPGYLTPSDVEPYGFGLYAYTPKPEVGRYEKVVESSPQKNSEGIWVQQWLVVEMSEDEKLIVNNNKEDDIRGLRNYRLLSSDWTHLLDNNLTSDQKNAWILYRQSLRDISEQSGFPWDINWPIEPN